MPRFRKRRLGSRRYMDFSEENVQTAITAIQQGMSRREAKKVFGVSKTTLGRRLKGYLLNEDEDEAMKYISYLFNEDEDVDEDKITYK